MSRLIGVFSSLAGAVFAGTRKVSTILGLCQQDGTQLQTFNGENIEVRSWAS